MIVPLSLKDFEGFRFVELSLFHEKKLPDQATLGQNFPDQARIFAIHFLDMSVE